MPENNSNRNVVLREERIAGDYRYLGAEINKDGDLVIEGQDLGPTVKALLGDIEYEWCWTIKAQDIHLIKQALKEDGDILVMLKRRFSGENSSKLSDFLQNQGIPFESWSRIGD